MENIFTIPVNIQIMVVAGFVGYFINSVGREKLDNFERVFSVFIFGTLGALAFLAINSLISIYFEQPFWGIDRASSSYVVWSFIVNLIFSAVFAGFWRKYGRKFVSRLAKKIGVYQDDHHQTGYDSFIEMMPSILSFIDLEMQNGKTYRSEYPILKKKNVDPENWVAINKDGIALYITAIYDAKGEPTLLERDDPNVHPSLSFIPISEIKYINVK